MAVEELAASRTMTEGQVREILLHTTEHKTPRVNSIHGEAVSARNSAKTKRRKGQALRQKGLKEAWSSKAAIIVAQKILVLADNSSAEEARRFWQSKCDFREALALRYEWTVPNTPLSCVCVWPGLFVGSCHDLPVWGFRHNELRDIAALKPLVRGLPRRCDRAFALIT